MREAHCCQWEQVEMDFILGIKAFDLDKMLGWEGQLTRMGLNGRAQGMVPFGKLFSQHVEPRYIPGLD